MKTVVYFDGVCNLCTGVVQFILKRNSKNNITFASLQGKHGQALLRQLNLPTDSFDSFILVENEQVYHKSTAALKIAQKLDGAWKLAYGLIIVPTFIRDFVYDLIAQNRYSFFGKKNACWLPTPELEARFLN